METVTAAVLGLVRTHSALMLPIVFCLAFGESLALVSLLLPAPVILVALGGLIGVANVTFWPVWGAAAAGAAVGDWVSYWLGFHYQARLAIVTLSDPTDEGPRFLLAMGSNRCVCRPVFGPLRCIVPVVAGVCEMKQIPFQVRTSHRPLCGAAVVLAPRWAAAALLLQ